MHFASGSAVSEATGKLPPQTGGAISGNSPEPRYLCHFVIMRSAAIKRSRDSVLSTRRIGTSTSRAQSLSAMFIKKVARFCCAYCAPTVLHRVCAIADGSANCWVDWLAWIGPWTQTVDRCEIGSALIFRLETASQSLACVSFPCDARSPSRLNAATSGSRHRQASVGVSSPSATIYTLRIANCRRDVVRSLEIDGLPGTTVHGPAQPDAHGASGPPHLPEPFADV